MGDKLNTFINHRDENNYNAHKRFANKITKPNIT